MVVRGVGDVFQKKAVKLSSVFRSTKSMLKGEATVLYFCRWCFFYGFMSKFKA